MSKTNSYVRFTKEGNLIPFEPMSYACVGKAGCPNRVRAKMTLCQRCVNTSGRWYADKEPTAAELADLMNRMVGFHEVEDDAPTPSTMLAAESRQKTWWDRNCGLIALILLGFIAMCILTCAGLGIGWLCGYLI